MVIFKIMMIFKIIYLMVINKINSHFYCLNCVHSFRTNSKLESHKKVCENKDFCNIMMSSVATKIFHAKVL